MEDLKLAILIDADNISPKYVKVILDEAATFGVAACKRIYGRTFEQLHHPYPAV